MSNEKAPDKSIEHFKGHVQLKGLRARTVEAYVAMVRLLAQWVGGVPAELSEEGVREYFLHLVREMGLAPQTVRQARASLTEFFAERRGPSNDSLNRLQSQSWDRIATPS